MLKVCLDRAEDRAIDMVTTVPVPRPEGRRGRIAAALALCCLVLAVPGWAVAEPAPLDAASGASQLLEDPPPTDTVTKTVKDVLAPVRETAKPVTDTVDDAVEPVTETVREVTEPISDVTDPVTDMVDPVTDVVDPGPDVVDPGPDPRRPPGAREGDVVVPPVGGGRAPTGPGQASPTGRRGPQSLGVGPRSPSRTNAGVLPPALLKDTQSTPARPQTPAATPAPIGGSTLDQVARGVAEASRAFRFPLLLAAAVLLFLALQGRIDARDPKLAQRPPEQELTFA